MATGFLAPAQLARLWRAENPGKADDIEDRDLIRAIEIEDPDTFKLIDPLLIGAENLPAPKAPPPMPKLVPPDPDAGILIPSAARIVPSVLGAAGGFALGGPPGAVIGGALGAGAGETGGQYLEKRAGSRQEMSPGSILFETILGAANPTSRSATLLGRVGEQALFGTTLGAGGSVGRSIIEHNELPSARQFLTETTLGTVFGGAAQAGLEAGPAAYRGIRRAGERAAPSFGDATGALPLDTPPELRPLPYTAKPPEVPGTQADWDASTDAYNQRTQRQLAAQQLVVAKAAMAQYEAEEKAIGQKLNEMFGQTALVGGKADLHTLNTARDYLQQAAELRAQMVAIPPIEPPGIRGATPLETDLLAPPANPGARLLPERAGPSSTPGFVAYPGAAPPSLEEIVPGSFRRIIAGPPPVDPLEEALYGALQAPPSGPPRLVPGSNFRLRSDTPPAAPTAELSQGALIGPPSRPDFGTPIPQQTARLGGARGTGDQPLLPEVGRPTPLDDRPYAEGPNAGPRRQGEAHGSPRTLRRRILVGGEEKYETYPSTLVAEDPATYPPEVRRELAAMAWELERFPHTRFGEGVTSEQVNAIAKDRGDIDVSGAVGELRAVGATAKGATAGAPVYHEVIRAADGSFKHVTRADMLRQITAALKEGRGTGLTDAAAQVARGRMAQRARGVTRTRKGRNMFGEVVPEKDVHAILAEGGYEGDDLIGWADPEGTAVRPGHLEDEATQAVREWNRDDLLNAVRIATEAGGITNLNPETQAYFRAAGKEAYRRGLIKDTQLPLRMEGPGGAGGPSLFDFEGGPPKKPAPTRAIESQSELPGTEGVRAQEIPTPEVAEVPFALQAPPSKPGPAAPQPTLFEAGGPPAKPKLTLKEAAANELRSLFEDEKGELILGLPPAGDRRGLRAWLKQLEETHGGEAWFNRVEQAIEDGDWDRAWKIAAGQVVRSYNKASAAVKTPQQEAALARAVKGTVLQQDLPAQIVSVGRQGQQNRPAPDVKDLPPSYKVTTRQQGQGMTLGPAGLINPGPPQAPPPRKARAETLDQEIMAGFVDEIADQTELIHLIRNNRDAALRLGRQVTDLVVQGQVKFDPADFPGLTREEVGRQYMHTLSEAGRILGMHGRYVQEFSDELHEMADRMDLGAALAGTLGGRARGGRPPVLGARGRETSRAAAEALDRVAEQTAIPAVTTNLLRNDLQKPRTRSTPDLLVDSQYAFLTGGFATAMRNAYTTLGRYSWDLLDQVLTIPTAAITGEPGTGAMAGALLRERVGSRHTNVGVTPKRAMTAESFEDIYNLTAATLGTMKPTDARRSLKILAQFPDEAAHMIGWAGGEDLATEGSSSTILNALLNPKVQRFLTMFNRAQEFTGRALTFDTHFRAQLRARGRDPIEVLRDPAPEAVAAKVGGPKELEKMLRYASNAALEMTWAGQLANRSIPGALVKAVQDFWPAKLVQRFPRFNFSAAPRWIYDHSPAALLDLLRLPFDAAGWTSTGKHLGGGRLYRGLKAQQYQTDVIPALLGEISAAEGRLGDAVLELQGTSREWRVRNRQVARLEKQAQQGLPNVTTALEEARRMRDQLAAQRQTLQGQLKTEKTTIQDLTAQEKKLWAEVQNATGISAPTWSSWMARMTSGTFGLLGAAIVVRSQPGAEGTRFYQYRIEDEEGGDPFMLDLRSAAPFVQYLMVADVLVDFWRHTNWEGYHQDLGEATMNPLRALWNNYEGKYTQQLLGAEFAQAFLSISRAAGTTLTIADLMTRNGWPGPNEAADALIGTIGQFLAGYATPLGQFKDVLGQFSDEEAQVRATPRPSLGDPASWSYPLAEGLGRIPVASRLLPPTYSQTTGQPVRSVNPGVRAVTGIGGSQADFIQEEVRRIGLPGSTVYFRETGDYGLDSLLAQTYARVLNQELPGVLESDDYQQLGTPATQRDYLQRIFPLLKRAALNEVRDALGVDRVQEAMTTGEEARRQTRQQRLLERLGEGLPEIVSEPEPAPEAPPAAPPPAPF